MPQCCAVPMCSRKKGGHKFPKDKERLKQWIVAIRRDFTPTKHSIVCKEHFTKDDFELPKDSVLDNPRPMLKKTAVPSIFPWDEDDYDLYVHKKKVGQLRRLERETKKKENLKKKSLVVSSNTSDTLPFGCSEGEIRSPSNNSSTVPNDIVVQRLKLQSKISEETCQNYETKMDVTIKVELESDTDGNIPDGEHRAPNTGPAVAHVWEVPIMSVVNIKREYESEPDNDDELRRPSLEQLPPVKSQPAERDDEQVPTMHVVDIKCEYSDDELRSPSLEQLPPEKSQPAEQNDEKGDAAREPESSEKQKEAADTASAQQTHQSRKKATTVPGGKRYQCTVCRKCFSGSQSLKAHSRRHTGEKPYACNDCDRRFTDRSSLRRHLKTHTGEKPFECNTCQYRCSEKSQLQTHVRTHTGEKPFECNVCNHRFTDKSTLLRHARTHTGEKPFECDVCQRRFNQNSSLRVHLMTHTREKPHKCKICDIQFANKQYLEIHSRMHIRIGH